MAQVTVFEKDASPFRDVYIKDVLGAKKEEVKQRRPGDTRSRLKYRLKDWDQRPGEPVFLSNQPTQEGLGCFGGPEGESVEEMIKRVKDYTRPQEAGDWLLTVGELIVGYVRPSMSSPTPSRPIEEAHSFLEKATFKVVDGVDSLVFEKVNLRCIRHPGAVVSNKYEGRFDTGLFGTLTIPLQ